MRRRLDKAIAKWLGHELAGRERPGERALTRVFARLPRPLPSAGFAERVLLAAGLTPGRARDLAGLEVRALVALACALSAVSIFYVPSVLSAISATVRARGLVDLAAGLLVELSQRVAASFAVWDALRLAGRVIAEAAATPGVMATLALAALVSAGAFRLLQELVIPERSRQNAR